MSRKRNTRRTRTGNSRFVPRPLASPTEIKSLTTNITFGLAAGVTNAFLLNSPLQGLTQADRVGAQIALKDLHLRILCRNNDPGPRLFRIMVIHNSRNNNAGGPPDYNKIFDEQKVSAIDMIVSQQNPHYRSQYKFLYDQVVVTSSVENNNSSNTLFRSIDLVKRTVISYGQVPPVTTGDPSVIVDHAIFVLVLAETPNFEFAGSFLTRFVDQ